MMRSLWTAASGMIGQQTALDVTANNLSNVNTTGYKTQSANFKSLIYQNLQRKSTTTTGEPKPIGAQVGLGTRVGSISSSFTQGAFGESHGEFDYAIQGEGFFRVRLADGSIPMDPVIWLASSESMSPKMLEVTMTSNCLGARTSCMAALST